MHYLWEKRPYWTFNVCRPLQAKPWGPQGRGWALQMRESLTFTPNFVSTLGAFPSRSYGPQKKKSSIFNNFGK